MSFVMNTSIQYLQVIALIMKCAPVELPQSSPAMTRVRTLGPYHPLNMHKRWQIGIRLYSWISLLLRKWPKLAKRHKTWIHSTRKPGAPSRYPFSHHNQAKGVNTPGVNPNLSAQVYSELSVVNPGQWGRKTKRVVKRLSPWLMTIRSRCWHYGARPNNDY